MTVFNTDFCNAVDVIPKQIGNVPLNAICAGARVPWLAGLGPLPERVFRNPAVSSGFPTQAIQQGIDGIYTT